MAKAVACLFAVTFCATVDRPWSSRVLDADSSHLGPNEKVETASMTMDDEQEEEGEESFIDDDQGDKEYGHMDQETKAESSQEEEEETHIDDDMRSFFHEDDHLYDSEPAECCFFDESGADSVCFNHGTAVRYDCKVKQDGTGSARVDVVRATLTCDAGWPDKYWDIIIDCEGVSKAEHWGACASREAHNATDVAVRLNSSRASATNPDRMCYLESVLGTEGHVLLDAGQEAPSLPPFLCEALDGEVLGPLGWKCSVGAVGEGQLIVMLSVHSDRVCEIIQITAGEIAGKTYTGQQLLDVAIATCETAGYRVQTLTDLSRFPVAGKGHFVWGRDLGLVHRGWTWYMRNGFLPAYLFPWLPPVEPAVSIASHGGVVNVSDLFGPHLRIWCRGVNDTRTHFGDLTGEQVGSDGVTKPFLRGIFEEFKNSHETVGDAWRFGRCYRMSDLPGASDKGPKSMNSVVKDMLALAGCPSIS